MRDNLGKRMKEHYENRTRYYLPRRTYTILRVDGKAFHTLTRGLERPFDSKFISCMEAVAVYLLDMVQGAVCSYMQSDEVSVLMTDFNSIETEAWFDGNIQKIVSVTASMASVAFNSEFSKKFPDKSAGVFDCRAFTIPDPVEVENYFIWRQKDAIRNSILSMGQSCFSTKELEGKSCKDIREMLKGIDKSWEGLHVSLQSGSLFRKDNRILITEFFDFVEERERLRSIIPQYPIYDELVAAGIEKYEDDRDMYYDTYREEGDD